jgi:hypothetical protein
MRKVRVRLRVNLDGVRRGKVIMMEVEDAKRRHATGQVAILDNPPAGGASGEEE